MSDSVASSAKRIVKKSSEIFGRSFINNKKSIGPNTLPYGTPQEMQSILDKEPLIKVCCERLDR